MDQIGIYSVAFRKRWQTIAQIHDVPIPVFPILQKCKGLLDLVQRG